MSEDNKPKGKQPGSAKKKDKNKTSDSEKGATASGSGTQNEGQLQGQKKPEGQGQSKIKVVRVRSSGSQGESQVEQPATLQKSKAELKAERRAKQEAQRARKKGETSGATASAPKKEPLRVPDRLKADDAETQKKVAKLLVRQQVPQRTVVQRKVRLFSHLHQYERDFSITRSFSFSSSGMHPAIIKLGLQYSEGVICGSNARCISLLATLKQVIADYVTPPQKELSRDLDARIKPYISFLTQCRPLSVSMGNAIQHMRHNINNIPQDMPDQEAKQHLIECIDRFYEEKIEVAGKYVTEHTCKKIADGDVIVVYGCSSLIRQVLSDAQQQGQKFRVIVVDGRPRLEGKEMLRHLVKANIRCSYVLISAASYVMKEATKVLLGAHALLANGCVMSRVGSSLIALTAKSCNVPVLVCCETYKFSERVQTDSFVSNELGDPDDLVDIGSKSPYLADWRDYQSLSLLNLVYDVTPPEFISMVITEFGMIPCTSVPVMLRVKHVVSSET